MSNSNNTTNGCGIVAAIGCGFILLFVIVPVMSLYAGSNFVGPITLIVVTGLLIWLAVRKSKKNKLNFDNVQVSQSRTDQSAGLNPTGSLSKPTLAERLASAASIEAVNYQSSLTSGAFPSPICTHSFTEAQLAEREQVVCPCQFTYQTADLRQYAKLLEQQKSIAEKISDLRDKIRSASSKTSVSAYSDTQATSQVVAEPEIATISVDRGSEAVFVTAAAPAKPAPAPKPVKPRIAKPKKQVSVQQWLIIGASILVLVAGSVFVSSNINSLPQEAFQAITIGVALVTAVGAFKARSMSVLLANFLAAFSSSMQLATLSIIGDQLTEFTWDSMPAWWWALELLAISAIATLLAKFSKNFGWKGIALLSSTGAALVLAIGVLREAVEPNSFAFHLALLALTAVAVLLQTKFLRNIPQPVNDNEAMKAYLEELAEREDNSLVIFGRISAALQLVVALGLSLVSVVFAIMQPLNTISLLALVAVLVGVVASEKLWLGQLSKTKELGERIGSVARGLIYLALTLALISATSIIEDYWVNTLLGVLALTVTAVASKFARAFKPSLNMVTAGLFTGATFWLIWVGTAALFGGGAEIVAVFAIGFALALSVTDWLLNSARFTWVANGIHALAVLLLFVKIFTDPELEFGSLNYALSALALAALTNLQLPIRAWIAKKQSAPVNYASAWLPFAIASVIVIWAQIEVTDWYNVIQIEERLALSFVFMGYAVIALSLATWTKLKENHRSVLTAQNYLGQLVTVLSVIFAWQDFTRDNAATYALLIACLAIINYVFGSISRNITKMQLGYTAAIASFFAYQWTLAESGLVTLFAIQVAVIAASTWLHSWLLRKRSDASDSTLVATAPVAIGASLIVGFILQITLWAEADTAGMWSVISILAAFALASAIALEIKAVRKVATRAKTMQLATFVYSGFAIFTNFVITADETFEVSRWRLIATALLVAAIAIRAVQRDSQKVLVAVSYLASVTIGWSASELIQRAFETGSAPEPFSFSIALSVVLTTLLVGKQFGRARRILLIDMPIVATALVSVIYGFLVTSGSVAVADDLEGYLRQVLGFAAIATLSYIRIPKIKNVPWMILGYTSAASAALALASLVTAKWITEFNGPEIYTVLLLASILLTNCFTVRVLQPKSTLFQFDLPLLVVPLSSAFYGFTIVSGVVADQNLSTGYLREILGLALVAALAYVRISTTKARGWVLAGYLAAASTAFALASMISDVWVSEFNGPEIYTSLFVVSLIVSGAFAKSVFQFKTTLVKWDIPTLIIPVSSAIYGFAVVRGIVPDSDLTLGYVREILGLAAVTALAFVRISTSKAKGWIITAYVISAAMALSLGNLITNQWLTAFDGPEFASLLVTASILATHRFALKHLNLKGTLFSWGLPIGTALLPSTFYTYAALNTPFEQLDAIQISRVVAVLLVSIALMVFGVRRGNLANASLGIAGLTLLLIPNTAMHSDDVVPDSQVESTALVIGILLFGLLALLRRNGKLSGNSLLFIGVPITVILAPALVKSLIALGNPELTTVDWWRFGIVLAGSLTLLIVGSMRELAGMFYPGLLSVVLSVLPYGFKQTENEAWFLWVLLLLVAGVMVWIAVRLEKMKKAGRSSAAWLKELK